MASTFKIDGMTCSHCIKAVTKALEDAGIKHFKVELGLLELDLTENLITVEKLKQIIKEAGYDLIE
ncbi:MAG: cation transporter [Ignavibacterium sp.]|nr:cation transporter [Ignavibacterium sp.]MDW8374620.1 cation transporter [Ignavibacteriales bacterium]